MPLVKAEKEVRVVIDANVFTVGTDPISIPDALVDAAVSQGCVVVQETKQTAAPKKPTPSKPVEA
jgi:hypothetical protein